MKILNKIIEGIDTFTNWVLPDNASLALEWKVEWLYKNLNGRFGDIMFDSAEEFIESIEQYGSIIDVDRSMWNRISGTTDIESKAGIMGLISGYVSYPKYRNEDTIDAIYDGYKTNNPMKLPIVLKYNDRYRIFSGNTRGNIALQLDVPLKVLLFDLDKI